MAVFVIDVNTDKAEAGVTSLAGEVGSLSSQFDALQAELGAAQAALDAENAALLQNANLMRAAAEATSLAAQQKAAFAYHGQNAYKPESEKDILAGVHAEQMANLNAYASASAAVHGREKAQIAEIARLQKEAFAKHDQDAEAAVGLKKQREEAAQTSQEFKKLGENADVWAERLEGVRQMLVEVAQAAVIAVGILAAYGAAIYSLAQKAVALTQEKDALRATFDVFTGGQGDELLNELEDLAAELPFTADALNAWAKSLLAAGIKGDALKQSIRAVAAATAIMGESGGRAAEGLLKRFAMMAETGQEVSLDRRILSQLAEAGVSAQALAQALGVPVDKLGKMKLKADDLGKAMQKALIQQGEKPLKQMGQTWTSITAKIKEGFDDAFEDLGDLVHPFMFELQSLASEFFAGGIASGTWKDMVRAALTSVFEVGRRTARALHIAFLEVEIAFLKAKIALAPLTNALKQVGISGGIVNVVMYLLGASALILAVVFGVLALAVLLVAAPFIIAGIAIYAVVRAIGAVIDFIGEAIANFDNMKAAVTGWASAALEAGAQFVAGLVSSLLSGVGKVADAAKGLATAAKNAVFGALGIQSPSRVMIRAGRYTAQGLAQGIDAGSGGVEAAARGNADAAVAGASSPRGRATGGGGTVQINVSQGAVVINAAPGTNVLDLTREALVTVLEQALSQIGALPERAT